MIEQCRFAGGLRAKHWDEMVVKARLGSMRELEICVKMGTGSVSMRKSMMVSKTYLNSFSSSITWMPCSYCAFVGASPTPAKWPFIVMTDGAVGYRAAPSGLFNKSWPFVRDAMLTRLRARNTTNKCSWRCMGKGCVDVVCCRRPKSSSSNYIQVRAEPNCRMTDGKPGHNEISKWPSVHVTFQQPLVSYS